MTIVPLPEQNSELGITSEAHRAPLALRELTYLSPSLPTTPYIPDFSVATGDVTDFTSGDYTNGARLFSDYAGEQHNEQRLTEGSLPSSLRTGAGTTRTERLLLITSGLGDPSPT